MIKKISFRNTYNFGRVSYLVIKEKSLYTGVCLEFDLVVKAPTQEEAKEHIQELATSWLRNVIKNRLPEKLLNKRAPAKYWKIAEEIDKKIEAGENQLIRARSVQQRRVPSELFFSIVQNYLGNNLLVN